MKHRYISRKDVIAWLGNVGMAGILLYQFMLRDVFGVPRPFLFVSGGLCVLCIIYAIMTGALRLETLKTCKPIFLMFLFHLYMFVAAFFSKEPSVSLSYWVNYSYDYAIYLCVLALWGMKKDCTFLIRVAGLAALVMACMLVFVPSMRVGASRARLAEGTNPNTLGLTLALGFWAIAYTVKFKLRNFAVCLAALVIFALAIIMTGSRKSLIVLAIAAAFFFALYCSNVGGWKRSLVIVIIAISSVFLVGLIVSAYTESSIAERFATSFESQTDRVRIRMLQNSVLAFLKNPIFGYGYQGYRMYYGGTYSHSTLGELIVNGGIIGSVLYVWVFAAEGKKLFSLRKQIRRYIEENPNDKSSEIRYKRYQTNMLSVLFMMYVVLAIVIIFMYSTVYQTFIAIMILSTYMKTEEMNHIEQRGKSIP